MTKDVLDRDVDQVDGTCRDCTRAAWCLRRLGFRDTFSWGVIPDSPNTRIHASHANSKGQLICTRYRSELAWLTAGLPTRTTVYVAHPLEGDFTKNVGNAEAWVRYLRRLGVEQVMATVGRYYDRKPLIQAPWLAAIEPDGKYPGGRDQAIADCVDMVAMFDELWLVGGRITDGMKREMCAARVIRDLTPLGYKPPKFVRI